MAKIFKGNETFWNGQEKKKPSHEDYTQEAQKVQREANVPSGGPMEKPSGKTMAGVFAMANEVPHQTVNKPPTSGSIYRASDSDYKATVGMDVELAMPSSNPSPRQHVNFFSFYL